MGQAFALGADGCSRCVRPSAESAVVVSEAPRPQEERRASGCCVGAERLCGPVVTLVAEARTRRNRSFPTFKVPESIVEGLRRGDTAGGLAGPQDGRRAVDCQDAAVQEAVQSFAQTLLAGVKLKLVMDGVGALAVEASLDSELKVILLEFNGVEKKVSLPEVRAVLVEKMLEVADGVESETGTWQVRLDLQDGRFVAFEFGSASKAFAPLQEAGRVEADYFSGCLRILAEAAKFQAVRAELNLGRLTLVGGGSADASAAPTFRAHAAQAEERPEAAQASLPGGLDADLLTAKLLAAAAATESEEESPRRD